MIESALTAAGLGGAAGLNSWAAFLVFGLLTRMFPGTFDNGLATFFSSTPVLIAMALMYALEFVADKLPAVDHAWDAVHTFIRPLAGTLLAFASLSPDVPRWMVVLAVALGGGAALGGHVLKATTRGVSTAMTGGVASPMLSIGEDVLAVGQAVVAVVAPWLLIVMVAGIAAMAGIWLRRRAIRTN